MLPLFLFYTIFGKNVMKLAKAFLFSAFFLSISVGLSFGTTHTITFAGASFTPNTMNVSTGDTIVWSGAWAFHAIQSTTIPSGANAWGPTDGNTTSLSYVVSVAGTYNYQCNIHYLMGMTGSFTATAPAVKAITLSTTTVDFGSKRVGGSLSKTVTVTSKGPDAALTITSSPLTVGTMYTTSPTTTNRSISVNSTETETIKFTPTSRGTFYDTLTINSDATTTADQIKKVYISGTGINGVFSGPTTLSFDKVRVGNSKQLTYTFTNSGDDTLFLSSPALVGNGFTIVSGAAQNIAPGASGSIVIKFSPTVKQIYTGSFNITAQNNVNVPTVTIGGTGTAPIISLMPTSNYDMGIAFVGGVLTGSQQVTNTGDDTMHVSNVSIPLTQQGAKFTLTSPVSFTVLPGISTNITFSYTSSSESTDNASLVIASDDPAAATMQIALSARSGLPKMSLNTKDTIDFGSTRLGSSSNAFLTITNLGTYDLTFHIGNLSPDVFTLGSTPSSIPSQGNVQATFIFTPTAEGIVTGMAIVSSNDSKNNNDTIYFKGAGIKSALDFPASIDFHEVNINKTRDSVLRLKNFGSGSAKIFSIKLNDPNNGFVLIDTTAHTIGAKDSISVKVRFAPSLEQTYSATISIVTDDGAAPTRQIALAGRGINSKLSTAPSAIDFGTLDTGKTLAKTFTITNNGSAAATITAMKSNGDPSFTLGSVTLPLQIGASASKDISVSFSPKTAGTFDGTATITATEGSPISVALHGKGKITITGSVARTNQDIGLKMQIYPNPNNGTATIGISCSKQMDIKLALYDATGKFIQSYDKTSFSIGEYTLPLRAESLTSGEYYLRAVSGGAVAVEMKVVVVR